MLGLAHLKGTVLLAKFYLKHILTLRDLPPILKNSEVLEVKLNGSDSFSFSVPSRHADSYNKDYLELKQGIKETGAEDMTYRNIMISLFLVRVVSCAMAFAHEWELALAMSSLQFVFAPYSFIIAMTSLFALGPPIYYCHYATWWCCEQLLTTTGIMSFLPELAITINFTSIGAFIVLDQLLCVVCTKWTPDGAPDSFDFKTTMVHAAWGFFNCKTYYLLLLPLLYGIKVNMWVWLVLAATGATRHCGRFISSIWLHWTPLFYHQHRIGHLPRVYEHAHKFHHYLHGTNAFDAHIYGQGMPEEWFQMIFEVIMGYSLGLPPSTFNPHVLWLSWTNKTGHTRKLDGSGGKNHHADHHTLHSKNFSIYGGILDMYFGTNSHNEEFECGKFLVKKEKKVDGKEVRFEFTPRN